MYMYKCSKTFIGQLIHKHCGHRPGKEEHFHSTKTKFFPGEPPSGLVGPNPQFTQTFTKMTGPNASLLTKDKGAVGVVHTLQNDKGVHIHQTCYIQKR